MFLDGWKQNLLKTKVKKLQKSKDANSVNSLGEGVGLLVNIHEFQDLEKLRELMKRVSESVCNTLIFYSEEKAQIDVGNAIVLSKKDFTFSGSLKNSKIQEFVSKPFTVLIGYYHTENVFLDFVSAQSKALFKVGISSDLSEFNDLTIKSKLEDVKQFENELLKYLKLLNRID